MIVRMVVLPLELGRSVIKSYAMSSQVTFIYICLWGSSRRSSEGCHRLFSGVRSSLSFKGRIQTEACVIPNYHRMLIPWQ